MRFWAEMFSALELASCPVELTDVMSVKRRALRLSSGDLSGPALSQQG